jgi:hypothetical protein
MKLDNLKEKQGLISTSLLCASGVLGVLILVKLGSFFATSAKMERLVEEAVAQSKADPNDAKEYLAKFKEVADELKKKNMFAPPPPKPGWPVSRVEGILGDTALINGGWRKVGDDIGGAKVLEIKPTYVKVVWEGKEKIFSPFDIKDAGGTKSDSRKGEEAKRDVRRERGERRARPSRGGRGGFRDMSREERKRMREKMRDMSPEERREYMRKMREGSNGG